MDSMVKILNDTRKKIYSIETRILCNCNKIKNQYRQISNGKELKTSFTVTDHEIKSVATDGKNKSTISIKY